METVAKLYNSSYSPRKMRLLADLIRGMRADKALFVLKLNEKKAYAKAMEKLLLSAISNWKQQNGGQAEENELFVKRVNVDGGRMLKRIQAAPQGRAHRVRKRSNHITIVLGDDLNNKVATVKNETAIAE
jgi:large subunit ribosomal protein L22